MINLPARNSGAISIGLICLDSSFPKPVGHIRNPATVKFPIVSKVLKGLSVKKMVSENTPSIQDVFMEAATALEKEGVSAITGSCGFMAIYQKQIADSVSVPVFMSSLIQIPMVSRMLRRDQKIGVITANKNNLSVAHFKAVGAEQAPIVVAGMENQNEFKDVILEGSRDDLDFRKLEEELFCVTTNLISNHKETGALVLECTDLTCFANSLRKRFGLPIYDLITLTQMIYSGISH